MLHGLFGNRKNNNSISKALARDLGIEVLTVDLRNHGDSPHDSSHDYPSMAKDIEHFMDANGLEKPIFIGHSMGAKAAMAVSLRRPTRVGALICVDNAPVDAPLNEDFKKYVRGMKTVLDAKVTRLVDADMIMQGFESSTPIRQFLLTNLIRQPGADHLAFRIPLDVLELSLGAMGAFPFDHLNDGQFDGPTLFIRGTRSSYIPDRILGSIGQFFPRFEVEQIDSGHWVISEQPEAFKKVVIRFLGRHGLQH